VNKERTQFMKTCKPVLRVSSVLLAFACIATAADAPKLTFKFKTISVPKALQTSTYGINNRGDIVGYYIDQRGAIHGLLLEKGKKVINIDDPNSTYGTEPNNLNSNGTIVGVYLIDSAGDVRGFSYHQGRFKDVGPQACKGPIESGAYGINDKGDIVGFCTDSSNVVHGYLWNGKKYTPLDYPGANDFTLPWGINNAGLVTLQWIDSSSHYEGGTYNSKTKKYSKKPINVPGAVQTYIHSINNAGDIVFSWYDSSGNSYGALRMREGKNFKFYTFSDPKGPNYTRPDGINDRREIVGRYESTGAQYEQGFEATY